MTALRPPARHRFACSECGASSAKWQGRCDCCGAWNTVAEAPQVAVGRPRVLRAREGAVLALVAAGPAEQRRATGIAEVDRVLGGGVVAGSLVLLGGDPGIGKSTLALQLAARLGSAATPVLYCAGEESVAQIAMRAMRLGCPLAAVAVLAETDLDSVEAHIEADRPPLAVVDSVQTLRAGDVAGTPGSPAHVREAVARLLAVSKRTDVPIVLVGHVTKDGAIAGPRTLEHMVDVVLYLEGERHGEHRLLRGVKNRFGGTGELGLFTMDAAGLREVDSAGRAFVEESSLAIPGNMLTVTCEGTRPLLVEIQALVAPTTSAFPRRTCSGFEPGRLHLLLAVLERRAGVSLSQADVYLNVVGGVHLADPATDLGVVLALASAAGERAAPAGVVAIGEVGLGGEVRRAARLSARLAEAAALGQAAAMVPAQTAGGEAPPLQLHAVSTVSQAIELLGA